VIDTVEHVVQEAQATQNDICGEFERQLQSLSTEKTALEDENYQVWPSPLQSIYGTLSVVVNIVLEATHVESRQLLCSSQYSYEPR